MYVLKESEKNENLKFTFLKFSIRIRENTSRILKMRLFNSNFVCYSQNLRNGRK